MLVGFRATAHLDEAVLQWARPDRGWGPRQERVDGWADMLPTWRSYALLTAIAVFTSMVRRSWRPLAVGTSVMVGVALLVTFIKIAVPREDPTGAQGHLGAFASGHVAAAVALVAGASLVLTGRLRWTAVPAAAIAAVMSYVLVVTGFHWVTDCVGGVLATVVVVTGVRVVFDEREGLALRLAVSRWSRLLLALRPGATKRRAGSTRQGGPSSTPTSSLGRGPESLSPPWKAAPFRDHFRSR